MSAAWPELTESQKLESLGLLAGTIAHDFKNVLAVILGRASLATAELNALKLSPKGALVAGPVFDQASEALREIESAAERGADLCRQLLAYAGRSRFVVGRVDLGRLVTDTEALLRMSVRPNVRLELGLGAGLPLILADSTQVQQILFNLVINAVEAVGAAEGVVRIRAGAADLTADEIATAVVGRDAAPGRYVRLEVRDDGCGMTPETIRRVFDPFFTTKPTGRGLGLATVLGAVRSHGGVIMLESTPGRGTSFRLFFPVAEGATVVPSVAPPPATLSYRGDALVIDDDVSVAGVIARMLESVGFEVSVAHDASDGVDLVRGQPRRFRCAFLDWTMPGLHGKEAFRRLREASPGLPTILMSGYSEEEVLSAMGAAEGVCFLAKPFRMDSVQESLLRLLGPG